MKLTLERQIPLGFVIAIILLAIIILLAFRNINSVNEAIRWEKHTQQVLLQLDEVFISMVEAESSVRGFMTTQDETLLEPYSQAQQEAPNKIAVLRELVTDNAVQQAKIKQLEELVTERLSFLKQVVEVRRTKSSDETRAQVDLGRGRELSNQLRQLTGEIKNAEQDLLVEREAALNKSISYSYLMLFVIGFTGLVALGFANSAIYREIGKRRRAENELRDANEDLETRIEARTQELSQKNIALEENEAVVRRSEIFRRAILDSLSAHIAVIDKAGNIAAVNRAWERFAEANCVEEQIGKTGIGQNYLSVCENSDAFDEQTEKIVAELRRVLDGKSDGFAFEYPCHSPTEERWFLLQVSSLKSEEGGAVVSHINITDRKRAEAELRNSEEFTRSIFENSPDCVKVLELDGTLHSMNKNGLCIMEIDSFEDFQGKQWVDFWDGDENELAYQAVRSARTGKTANFQGFCRTAKGTEKWWDVSVAPVFDGEGNPVRLISTSRDITERRQIERERETLLKSEQAARKEAEIANRMRDEFLATVSHELRAPLNSILGWGKLLEKGNLDDKTSAKAVQTIVRNADSQNRLIEDLLDVSRIISGKLRLEVITIKPINFVEAALETVRPAAEAKNIKLEIKQDSVVSHISGDPNRLQQVIWNLLSNAIKFTPAGGTVTVEIERMNGHTHIRVCDSGIGISKEFLPHVFDRFRQADASSIRKFGGLGLGLAIVRHIVEMHGGTVFVHSDGENCGSTFTVQLPVIASPKEEIEGENFVAKPLLDVSEKLGLDGLLILVVDDEEDTRQLLVQALTFYGATVITAKSASEGLSELQEKSPDVLVSDIGMPDEDGYSLIRKVRALTDDEQKNTIAVALTAFTRAQDRMRALAAGYQNHVGKPVEPDELATVIASLTGRLQMD